VTSAEREAEVRRLLDEDDIFFAENALKIVDKSGRLVPFMLKEAQKRFYRLLEAQRAAGVPERVVILKARQIGYSTATQGTMVRRYTRRPNHRALVVAHDSKTAGSLFDMGERMVTHLPPEIRPSIESRRNALGAKYLKFGTREREARDAGDVGLNSSIEIDTARESDGGRGHTYHSLHLSECAFWDYPQKLTSLLNAVPYEPGTLVVVESTANGLNHFKAVWDAAVDGSSRYAAFFSPWHEEPSYALAFASEAARVEFERSVGKGPWGEDEPRLVEEFGCTLEQLAWRRLTIVANCEGKLERWNAEYPASPEDAFVATGKHTFALTYIKRVIARAEKTDGLAELGLLQPGSTRERLVSGEMVEVPESALWVPRDATGFGEGYPFWRVWEHPGEDSQHVVFGDVAGGEESTSGEGDYHAIQVIDHRTLEQVAEYRSRVDSDEFALQALLAALYYNEAWLAIETTGGWGIPVVKDYLWRRYGYRKLYKRTPVEQSSDAPKQRLGWDTNRKTKPEMIAGAAELLREGNDGIKSLLLAREMLTFVKDSQGRSGAEHGHFDDLLMAWMGGQQVARERRLFGPSAGSGSVSYVGPRDPRTGY
jgi:hypothetical protein